MKTNLGWLLRPLWIPFLLKAFLSYLSSFSFCVLCFVVRKNEADNPMPCSDLYTSAVFRCCPLSSNEWEEAYLDLSRLWQKGCLWKSHLRWVSVSMVITGQTTQKRNRWKKWGRGRHTTKHSLLMRQISAFKAC